jgi:hypothetical protein
MKHYLAAAVVTTTLAFAGVAEGQIPGIPQGPGGSKTEGFSVGLYLNGTAAQYEGDSTIESGGGLALRAGYGLSPNFDLFAQLTGASVQHDGMSDRYGVGHFDLGAQYNFGQAQARLRPYMFGALSGRAVSLDIVNVDMRGAGFSFGGGLRYFFNPAFAVDANLGMTFGSLGEGRLAGGSWEDLGNDSVGMTSSRFNLGISWHP